MMRRWTPQQVVARGVATAAAFEPGERHIVVARYNEDVSWLAPCARDVVLYNKRAADDEVPLLEGCAERHNLPNVGREAHTYLTYIVTHYDALPPHVVFTQGCVADHPSWKSDPACVRNLLSNRADMMPGASEKYASEKDVAVMEGCRVGKYRNETLASAGMTLGAYWRTYVSATKPFVGRVHWFALLSVSARAIRSVPLDVYRGLLETVSHANAPEAAHFLERLWYSIFTHNLQQ